MNGRVPVIWVKFGIYFNAKDRQKADKLVSQQVDGLNFL